MGFEKKMYGITGIACQSAPVLKSNYDDTFVVVHDTTYSVIRLEKTVNS